MDICDIKCKANWKKHSLQTNETYLNPIKPILCYFSFVFPSNLPWFTVLGPAILDNSTTAPCFRTLAVSRCSKATCFFLKENGRTIFPQLHVKIADIFSVAVASSFQTASIYHSFIFICTIFLVIFAILCGRFKQKSFIYSQPLGANLPTQGMTLFEDVHHLSFLMDDLELHGFWVLFLQFICGLLCSFGTTRKATLIPPKRVALMILEKKTLPGATKPEFIKTFFIVSSAFARVRRKLILIIDTYLLTMHGQIFMKPSNKICKSARRNHAMYDAVESGWHKFLQVSALQVLISI